MNADRVATSTDAIELLPVTGLERDQEHGGVAESSYALGPPHGAELQRSRRKALFGNLCAAVACLAIAIVVICATAISYKNGGIFSSTAGVDSTTNGNKADKDYQGVSRIAFGSCSAYDEREVSIFDTGIIPLEPEAWIWVGDMVYMDTASVDCHVDVSNAECSCKSDFMRGPPTQCWAGDIDHARDKVLRFIGSPSYQSFLDYMCPGHRLAGHGVAVPHGTNPAVCPRPVLGTYDDHDFGWNNGNRRLPRKDLFKNLYLDAIGEPLDSPRRSMVAGLQTLVTLNSDIPEQQIDVFLLDERYERTPIPCSTHSRYCEGILDGEENDIFQSMRSNKTVAWCEDFLFGGVTGDGSCCPRDDELFQWCQGHRDEMNSNSTWEEACDPTSSKFGERNLVVREGLLQEADPHSFLDMEYDSQFCEVLGRTQRAWLREALQASPAPLKLIASGSPLLGRPSSENSNDSLPASAKNKCSGDDFDCYHAAQLNLLHTVANVGSGCVIILTGDYHYADLRSVDPYANALYSIPLQASKLSKPIYQVMASGLSHSTASGAMCDKDDLWMKDMDGLRMAGQCGFYSAPNFGMVEVDWETQEASLSIRTDTGDIAMSADGLVALEFHVDLNTCRVVRDRN